MYKSLGNGIDPSEITDEYGADILRLWVASSDYHADIRVSKDILKQLSEVYRKIRNTARYILGNLYDFNPDTDSVPDEQLHGAGSLGSGQDWIELIAKRVPRGLRQLRVPSGIYHAMHNFCTIDMSNFYLDIIKDRLYVEEPDSVSKTPCGTDSHLPHPARSDPGNCANPSPLPARKSGQTCHSLSTMTRRLAYSMRCQRAATARKLRNLWQNGKESMQGPR